MILLIATSLLTVTCFALVLWKSRILHVARETLSITVKGVGAMMDSDLGDETKEAAVKEAGLGLVLASFRILWRFAAALFAAAVPIFLANIAGLVPGEAVLSFMLRLDFFLIVSVLVIAVSKILCRRRGGDAERTSGANRYSAADRFFHAVAFSSPAVLKAVSWIEDPFFVKSVQLTTAPPIFITSLARGGTTALLNAISDMPGVATHTYRDMPFVTAPLLWSRLAGGKKRSVSRHQRAHGDGLEIDLNSPEALEEVLWKMFWPKKYRNQTIPLWEADEWNISANEFIGRNFAKTVAARLSQDKLKPSDRLRYCSKNNANIARIPYLLRAFPGCRIVVPVRRPECHAASLLRQHQNFLKQQSKDEFVKRYMRDIGHFEFGLIHKRFEFPGFRTDVSDPGTADYWLSYWLSAFRYILTHREQCIFVFQDNLRAKPQETMVSLCNQLGLEHDAMEFGPYFRAGADQTSLNLYDPLLMEEAAEVYKELELAGSQGFVAIQ